MSESNFLSEDEIEQIEQWKRGRQLQAIVHTEGWSILRDTLKRYADSAVDALLRLAPGDPTVPTAHAAASALAQQYRIFMEDIDSAIAAGEQVPEVLKQTLSVNP